jgi:hypothetical protein
MIGFNGRIYFEDRGVIVHARCLERELIRSDSVGEPTPGKEIANWQNIPTPERPAWHGPKIDNETPIRSDTEWNAFPPFDNHGFIKSRQPRPYMANSSSAHVVFADLPNHRFISRFNAPSLQKWSRYAPLHGPDYPDAPLPYTIRDYAYSPDMVDRPTPKLTWKRAGLGLYRCNAICNLEIEDRRGTEFPWRLIRDGELIAWGPTLKYVKVYAQRQADCGYIV